MEQYEILLYGLRNIIDECLGMLNQSQRVAMKPPMPAIVQVLGRDAYALLIDKLQNVKIQLGRLEIELEDEFENTDENAIRKS